MKYLSKIFIAILILFSFVNANASQAIFSAYLDRSDISAGQNFQMKLELINAEAFSQPDISVIPAEIAIKGKSQESLMEIVNNVSTKVTSWVYDLSAVKEGGFIIPAISIKTDKGTISSKPFKILIKPSTELPDKIESNDISVSATVDNKSPFQEQPILYRLKIMYNTPVEQADIVKPTSENATIEQLSQPQQTKETIENITYDVLTIDYVINPITAGNVIIEPAVLNGSAVKESKQERPRTAFDNFFDPFSMLDSGISIIEKKIPFSIASDKIILDVKPPISGVEPWLALYDLKLSSEIIDDKNAQNNQQLKVKMGEPINLKISMVAQGKPGDLLPNIEKYIPTDSFKVYSDKPEIKTEAITDAESYAESIKGIKTQLITLIPQKAGNIQIPEVRVNYWDIKNNKLNYTIIPARNIEVEEASSSTILAGNNLVKENEDLQSDKNSKKSEIAKIFSSPNHTSIIILILIIVIIILYNKVSKLSSKLNSRGSQVKISENLESKIAEATLASRKIIDEEFQSYKPAHRQSILKASFKDLILSASNVKELRQKIIEISTAISDVTDKATATLIAQKLAREFNLDKSLFSRLASKLDSAIYLKDENDLPILKEEFVKIFTEIEEKIINKQPSDEGKLTKLNPI